MGKKSQVQPNMRKRIYQNIIFSELTSSLDHPPIYGQVYQLEETSYGFPLNMPSTSEGNSRIFNNQIFSDDVRKINTYIKKCSFLTFLALKVSFNGILLKNQGEYNLLGSKFQDDLYNTIRERLREIGHLI